MPGGSPAAGPGDAPGPVVDPARGPEVGLALPGDGWSLGPGLPVTWSAGR